MKKIFSIITLPFLLIFSLVGCSKDTITSYYIFNHSDITQISVKTTIKEDVPTEINIKEEYYEELLNKFDSLNLVSTKSKDLKGWDYYFIIYYKDGKNIKMSFISGESGLVDIDGQYYSTNLYNSNDYLKYLD